MPVKVVLWSIPGKVCLVFFFQAEDGIRVHGVTGVQTCALPIWAAPPGPPGARAGQLWEPTWRRAQPSAQSSDGPVVGAHGAFRVGGRPLAGPLASGPPELSYVASCAAEPAWSLESSGLEHRTRGRP